MGCRAGGKGTNKEETRRVSDAANGKMESGKALPERSDRECDDKEETRRVSDAVNDKMESDEALPERSDRECDDKEETRRVSDAPKTRWRVAKHYRSEATGNAMKQYVGLGATAPSVTPCM